MVLEKMSTHRAFKSVRVTLVHQLLPAFVAHA